MIIFLNIPSKILGEQPIVGRPLWEKRVVGGTLCSKQNVLADCLCNWRVETTFNKLLTYHRYGNKVLVVKTVEISNGGENFNFTIFIFFHVSNGQITITEDWLFEWRCGSPSQFLLLVGSFGLCGEGVSKFSGSRGESPHLTTRENPLSIGQIFQDKVTFTQEKHFTGKYYHSLAVHGKKLLTLTCAHHYNI